MLLITEKINWKIFIPLSVLSTATSLFVMYLVFPGFGGQLSVVVFFLAVLINHLLMVEGALRSMAEIGKGLPRNALRELIFFSVKVVVFLVAILISIQFITTEIFIPLANYMAHIGILFFSFKRSA